MKIAYYIYWLDDIESGVIKKINDQINYWISKSNTVKLFILTKKDSKLEKSFWKNKQNFQFEIEIITFSNKIQQVTNGYTVYHHIEKYNPDLVYMRESKITPGIFKLNKKYKTILEINSITKYEVKQFSLNNLYNAFTNYFKFKYIKGFIAVTNEIADHKSIAQYSKPTKVIGNGINLNNIIPLEKKHINEDIHLVFIGTDKQKWHGLDKIIELAKIKPGWNFHMIGISNQNNNLNNINFYGVLGKNEYVKIFQKMDIAIGSLALFRKNLREACPLKTREYLAYSLPIIIGYDDVDFPEEYNFICKIENNENNIKNNIGKIEKFVLKWNNRRIDRTEIEHLDVTYKEKERLLFLKKTIQNAT